MLRNNNSDNYYCSCIPCCVYVAQLTIIQIIIAARVCVYIYIKIYVAQQTIIIQITAAPGSVGCVTIIMMIIIVIIIMIR